MYREYAWTFLHLECVWSLAIAMSAAFLVEWLSRFAEEPILRPAE